MLLYPSINTLNEKTDSRYSLCILAAKRARDLVDGKPALTEDECERPVSQAAKEVAEDLISYRRPSHEEAASVVLPDEAIAAEILEAESAEAEAEETAEAEVENAEASEEPAEAEAVETEAEEA